MARSGHARSEVVFPSPNSARLFQWRDRLGLAVNKLGLDHYRQLVIAMADADLALPGTDDVTLSSQANAVAALLAQYEKVDASA
jgi:hypothetical protein